MPDPASRSCPSWCEQPAGHLHVEPAGPGDYHVSEFTMIDLPGIPGVRDQTAIQVAIEQYVTATTTYQPMISLGTGAEDPDSEAFTLDEADTLSATLTRAVAAARGAQTGQPSKDDGRANTPHRAPEGLRALPAAGQAVTSQQIAVRRHSTHRTRQESDLSGLPLRSAPAWPPASSGEASSRPQSRDDETARMSPHPHAVPPALRPIVLLARMREILPPARLADLLATFDPPVAPTAPEWTDLCSALDAYDRAAQIGLSTEEARNQVDTAAMIFALRYSGAEHQPSSGIHERRATR